MTRLRTVCAYCDREVGVPFEHQGVTLTLRVNRDHFIPRSKGGSNEESNIRVSCDVCNCFKGSKLFTDMEEVRAACKAFWDGPDFNARRRQLAVIGRAEGGRKGGKKGARNQSLKDKARGGRAASRIVAERKRRGEYTEAERTAIRERALKGNRSRTREQKAESGRKSWLNKSPEGRERFLAAGAANRHKQPGEVRAANARKGRETLKAAGLNAYGLTRDEAAAVCRRNLHIRWHVRRNATNPNCALCAEAA